MYSMPGDTPSADGTPCALRSSGFTALTPSFKVTHCASVRLVHWLSVKVSHDNATPPPSSAAQVVRSVPAPSIHRSAAPTRIILDGNSAPRASPDCHQELIATLESSVVDESKWTMFPAADGPIQRLFSPLAISLITPRAENEAGNTSIEISQESNVRPFW